MNKVNELISFLKQIPYTECKTLYSCQHMSLEDDSPLGGQFIRVDEKGTTNYSVSKLKRNILKEATEMSLGNQK